jgi:cell wall assembly regulator SMI1
MPTMKTRMNVTIPPDVERVLARVAERDAMPPATKAAHLIRLALEVEEDEAWDAIAHRRDTAQARFVPHRRAWK